MECSLGINICEKESWIRQREKSPCNASSRIALAKPIRRSGIVSQNCPYVRLRCPGLHTLTSISHWMCGILGRDMTLSKGAVYSWGNPWRGWQMKVVCREPSLQLEQKVPHWPWTWTAHPSAQYKYILLYSKILWGKVDNIQVQEKKKKRWQNFDCKEEHVHVFFKIDDVE